MSSPVESPNRRRSERVPVQIPVILEAEIERGKLVKIEAFTLVVNAHGGLLEVGVPLHAGLKLSVVHPVSGLRKASKVVESRRSHDGDFAVAVEFDDPTSRFWPVDFPPQDWGAAESGDG